MDAVQLMGVIGLVGGSGLWGWCLRASRRPSSCTPPPSWKWGRGHRRLYAPFQPMVNVDGTPMLGSLDANGHPYGVTSAGHGGFFGALGRFFEPAVRIDGSGRPGGIATVGQVTGVTNEWGALDPVMSDSVGLTAFTGSASFSCGSSFDGGIGHGSGCGSNDW